MDTFILHLSDLHIKENHSGIKSRVESCIKTVLDKCGSIRRGILLLTGDIAFSGSETEYEHAYDIISEIISGCNPKLKFEVCVCPGNHDCRDPENTVRANTIDSILNRNEIKSDEINFLNESYKAFYDFRACISNTTEITPLRSSCSLFDGSVEVFSINSVICSRLKFSQGRAFVPLEVFDTSKSRAELKICLMHTPDNWFIESIHKSVRMALASNFDFVFTGHEHTPYNFSIISSTGSSGSTIMIEGGEFNPGDSLKPSAFNIISISADKMKYKHCSYQYCSELNIYVKSAQGDDEWKLTGLNTLLPTSDGFVLSDSAKKILTDPGAPYKHPHIEELALGDIYIHPNVRDMAAERRSHDAGRLNILNLAEILTTGEIGNILLFGGEKSGKSAACRVLFMQKINEGYTPILVSGEDIGPGGSDALQQAVKRSAKKFYSNYSEDVFVNIDVSKKVLIIDDFHLIASKHSVRLDILRHIGEHYPNVMVTLDEHMQLGEMLTSDDTRTPAAQGFKHCQVLPFGRLLRHSLIKNWYFGKDQSDYDNAMLSTIDSAERMLNVIVDKNLVPAFPFYLYTAISAHEAAPQTNISQSSFGHYYTTLLTLALAKIDVKNEEIELRSNYLSELARWIFDHKKPKLLCSDFHEFHKWYCDEYQIVEDGLKLLENFCKASILSKTEDHYYFKYKYFYYFFLARNIASNLSFETTKDLVARLCSTLHLESSANTIMFLTHLSKDPEILSTICTKAKEIFGKNTPTRLEDDVDIVNHFVDNLPSLTCDSNTRAMEFRKQSNIKHDEIMPPADIDECSGEQLEIALPEQTQDDLLVTMSASFKTMDIMGQILKNYYGSLKRQQKEALTQESYNLALRTLADFFNFLSSRSEGLIDDISKIILDNDISSEFDKTTAAKRYIFNVSAQISFAIIYRTAMALGSPNLARTFAEVLQGNPSTAFKLIDIGIKLDNTSTTPIEELKRLGAELEKNLLAHLVLQQMSLFHIYMHEMDYKVKQQLCDALKIKMQDQLAIEQESKKKNLL